MKCKDTGVTQVRVGLYEIGIVGFRDALRTASESGLTGQEEIVDLLMKTLEPDNYIPERLKESYRRALWREYLRHRGEDFSDYFSEVDVTVRGSAGEQRDEFVDRLRAVLRAFELNPVVTFAAPGEDGPNPQLIINDQTIVQGCPGREELKAAIHRSISGW